MTDYDVVLNAEAHWKACDQKWKEVHDHYISTGSGDLEMPPAVSGLDSFEEIEIAKQAADEAYRRYLEALRNYYNDHRPQ